MRTPKIVIYQGSRYRGARFDKETIQLVSDDPADLQSGFTHYEPGLYVKTVRRTEIDEAYLLYTWAQFRGKRYPVISVQDGKYQLFGDAGDKEFGFQRIDQSIWEGWVGGEELERVWEERKPF